MAQRGLRERKKAAAMHRIQSAALELFSTAGYDNVTIEQIADRADVSPSTVYRYFGTKEGLVLQDEHDDLLMSTVAGALADGARLLDALREAVRAIAEEHFVRDRQATVQRLRLYFEVPALRSAASTLVAELIDKLARTLKDSGRADYADGLIASSAVVSGLLAAAWNWYREGAEDPFTVYADAAMDVLAEKLTTM